ncbi:outer membrane beta-barrel protein [Chryseobacterium sp. 22543]|uniref:outer membrane beta-barrel protein n=1 Tax=Chryseobacterium sp. 22543 TaxID=3453940 RepID=UPI003F84EA03
MRLILSSALLLAIINPAIAQISGTVIQEATHSPLSQASLVLSGKGTSIILKSKTDRNGNFQFSMPTPGAYQLSITFLGYIPKTLTIYIKPEQTRFIEDTITLTTVPLKLRQVDVRASKPLAVMRGDTLEYNALDFNTYEKASLYNLLQKIPGLTIDIDGKFYYQGIALQELYIDGRPAFQNAQDGSSDPKIISRLLLASVVDKVQIIDKTPTIGINAPKGQKILNITINSESKKGLNGELGAGYGTGSSYKAAMNAARFRDHLQLMGRAAVSNLSSLTSPGTSDESMDLNTRFPGVTTDRRIALNAGFDAGSKAKFNFSFSQLERDNSLTERGERENFLPDSSSFYNTFSKRSSHITTTSFNTNFSYHFKNKGVLNIRADLFLTQVQNRNSNSYSTLAGSQKDTINTGHLYNNIYFDDKRSFVFADYSIPIKTDGAFRVSLNADFSNNTSRQYNQSLTFLPRQMESDTIDRLITPGTRKGTIDLSTMLFIPLGKGFRFQVTYNLNISNLRNNQLTMDFNDPVGKYELVDTSLSFLFLNKSVTQMANISIGYHKGKFNAGIGGTFNNNELHSSGSSSNYFITQRNSYVSPLFEASWNFSSFSVLRMDFSLSPAFPVIDRLVPVLMAQNPLQIQLGNPDLKPGFSRRLSLNYNFLSTTGISFSVGTFATFEHNAVSTSVTIDSLGKQTTQAINVSGTRSFTPVLNFGKRWQKSGISFSYQGFGDLRRSISYLNGISNISHTIFLNQDISLSWTYKSLLEISTNIQLNYRGNKYELQNNAYFDFLDQKIFMKVLVFLPRGLQVGTAALYDKNSGLDQSASLMNAWISKQVGKNKNWLVKLYGFDLLGQNKMQMANITPTLIDRTIGNSQGQYFLASVTRYFK